MNQEIETKECSKCNQIKSIIDFHKSKQTKDGLRCYCKKCLSIDRIIRYNKQKDKIKQEYFLIKDEKNKKRRDIYWANIEISREKNKIIRQKHPEYMKRWFEKNPDYYNKYYKKRRETDPTFKLLHNMRIRINDALFGNYKSGSTLELLSYNNSEEFSKNMEQLFKDGMSWNNYGNKIGQWSIDHIIPCSLFNLTDPVEQKQCFHHSNLQPMWHIDNVKKSNNIEGLKLMYRNNTIFI